jgi:hypothetical protein
MWSGSTAALCAMNGRLISVSSDDESSCFAFSAASLRRCSAILSFRRSTPCSSENLSARLSTMRWSKSSPPRCVSPFVDLTLKTPSADLEDRDVERAAAEIVDGDALGVLLLEPVGQRGRRRLVDDSLDVEPRDSAGVLRGLPLGVVEVGRDRHDRFGHRSRPERPPRSRASCEDDRAHLGRRHVAPADADPGVAVGRLEDLVRDAVSACRVTSGCVNFCPIRRLTA